MYDWKTCRVCLSQEEVEEMQCIFRDQDQNSAIPTEDIAAKIEKIGGIQISRDTAFAKMICAQCFINLTVANKFWKKVQESHSKLMEIEYESAKIEANTSEPDEILGNYEEMLTEGIEETEDFLYTETVEVEEKTPPMKVERKKVATKRIRKKVIKVEAEDDDDFEDSKDNKSLLNAKKRQYVKKEAKDIRDDIHICEMCGNSFKSKSILNLHMRRHQNIRPFKCEICSKNFACHSEIARHIRVHTGAKPFSCQYCDRKFSDRSTNIKHERTHTNERPFVCDQCGRAFMYSNVLKNHKLTHTGEKNFQCQPCNKTFARQHQLQQHMGTLIHKQTIENKVKIQ